MENFGIKDFYEITLKAIKPLNIMGTEFERDEVVLRVGSTQFSMLSSSKSRVSARGGYGNKKRVIWEDTQPLTIQIQKGVINKRGLSLLSNSKLIDNTEIKVPITFSGYLTLGEKDNYLELSHEVDIKEPYFLHDEKGNKISKQDYSFDGKKIIITNEDININQEFTFDYYYSSNSGGKTLRVGQSLFGGFLKFEGKTRVKDDIDGQLKTGIITIPQVRVMSDLSIRLGDEIEPFIYGFVLEGEPVGPRNDTYVYEITFLEENLEADI